MTHVLNTPPRSLIVAATFVVLQAAVLAFVGIGTLTGLVAGRVGVGIGIGVLLLVMALGLGYAAWSILGANPSARGPVVVAQLIALGLAWSLRIPDEATGDNRLVGALIAVSALTVLAALATKSARQALADLPEEQ
ncbi:MAG TPA: hypothetical protein PLQ19_04860 [Aeromicrobium sp.]|nr:hypothetical protein [Aeromicrobium sp.]